MTVNTIAIAIVIVRLCFDLELNEVSKIYYTPHHRFIVHAEKLKDTTHSLSQLSHSSRSLCCLDDQCRWTGDRYKDYQK